MSERTRVELETDVVESVTAETASRVAGVARSTLRDRGAPRNEDGSYSLPVLIQWLVAEITDERVAPPGGPSPELERWRKFRADREAFELAARRGELQPVAIIDAKYERCFAIMRAWAARIAGDHPAVFRSYSQAVRHACEEAARFELRPGCKRVLRLQPDDGSEPTEIDLGAASEEDVALPPVEEQESRRCSRCNGTLYRSWTIETDGSETPVWCCSTLNCLVRLPRHVEEHSTP